MSSLFSQVPGQSVPDDGVFELRQGALSGRDERAIELYNQALVEACRALKVGQSLVIGGDEGVLHNHASLILSRKQCTFTRVDAEHLKVIDGVLSEDIPHVFASNDRNLGRADATVSLKGGETIRWNSKFELHIPEDITNPTASSLVESELITKIRSLAPGKRLRVDTSEGNFTHEYDGSNLPQNIQCTFFKDSGGSLYFRDGLLSKNGVMVGSGNMALKIRSPLVIGPGTAVGIQEGLGFTWHPFASEAEEHSIPPTQIEEQSESSIGLTGYAEPGTVPNRVVGKAWASNLPHIDDCPEIEPSKLTVLPNQAVMLRQYIFRGLELLRDGRNEDAITHFRNPGAAADCGYDYEPNNDFTLVELSRTAIRKTLDLIASRSWFHIDRKIVGPSIGWISGEAEAVARSDVHQQHLLNEFQREVALIQAEEWCHAYQDALGKLVSRHAIFLSDSEHDVAQLMHEHEVPLSELYLKRYGRDVALGNLRRSEMYSGDELRIAAKLQRLSAGKECVIGRSEGCEDFQVRSDKQISRHHARIFVRNDGRLVLADGLAGKGSHNGTFYKDRGYWKAASNTNAEVLSNSVSAIRLGRNFEIPLAALE